MPSKIMKAITDRELVRIDAKTLHTMMEEAECTDDEKDELKTRRRRLQNRHSAKMSAARRQGKWDAIAATNSQLTEKIATLEAKNSELALQAHDARIVVERLFKENTVLQHESNELKAELRALRGTLEVYNGSQKPFETDLISPPIVRNTDMFDSDIYMNGEPHN
eukprot:m.120439 g.120439  ORF g.120439 m.120439 type:complete len:165 (-) comp13344_c0_seq3:1860-2354(-)